MSDEEIRSLVWQMATEAAEKGPGWSQEGVVLRAVGERIGRGTDRRPDRKIQQMILHAWHDLFAEKRLGWGYDLDNPNSPFFHIR
jgi:hypothetical protein